MQAEKSLRTGVSRRRATPEPEFHGQWEGWENTFCGMNVSKLACGPTSRYGFAAQRLRDPHRARTRQLSRPTTGPSRADSTASGGPRVSGVESAVRLPIASSRAGHAPASLPTRGERSAARKGTLVRARREGHDPPRSDSSVSLTHFGVNSFLAACCSIIFLASAT
jgi:hypothetical protein